MSIEITIIVTIISASIALAGLIITGQNSLRREMREQRKEINGLREAIGELRERMAHLEGLIEGLREAITGRRVAEDAGEYGTN